MKWLPIICLLVIACKDKGYESETKDTDSIHGMTVKEYKDHFVDSLTKTTTKKIFMDTAGISNAPVKVISAKMVQEEYSKYKSVRLTYKNVSGKKIEAIKFNWYGIDAFGEPADMGSFMDGVGGGLDDDPLGPGKSSTSTWSILSRNGKKVELAWAYEVAFSDGTKWKLKP
jgi:hypothetical protein